jgi:hypothetical protein
MIERLATQRACLDYAAAQIEGTPGPLLELGLGKGRTFDYLRRRLPQREIFVFEKVIHAAPDCIPDQRHLIMGHFLETLPGAAATIGAPAVLVHADIGSEKQERDAILAAAVTPLIDALVKPGAIVLGDREMQRAHWAPLPLPPGAGDWVYFLYRVGSPPPT